MTVIAVKKTGKKIEMASDSQTSLLGGAMKYEKREVDNDSKIFFVNGMLIGGAGHVSESSLFKMFCGNHKPKDQTADSVFEFVYEFRDWVAKKTGVPAYELKNTFLIVFGGKIFEANSGSVRQRIGFWAAGSGMFLALAALDLGKTPSQAVDIAKKYDLFCGGKTVKIVL